MNIDTEVVHIKRELQVPLKDYYRVHLGFTRGLVSTLVKTNYGVDVIFLLRQGSIKTLCKKVDRFWHNYRKTVNKFDFYSVKVRCLQIIVNSYEEVDPWMSMLNEESDWL